MRFRRQAKQPKASSPPCVGTLTATPFHLRLMPTPLCPAAVYDVTRAESFENLERIWMKEVDIYSNIEDAVKMVVANKVDLVSETRTGLSSNRR